MKVRAIGIIIGSMSAAAMLLASVAVPASAQESPHQSPTSVARAATINQALTTAPLDSLAVVPAGSVSPRTGQVEWACVGPDGSVYFLHGANARCTGSYLQEYVDGQQIRTISITQPLPPGDESEFDCLIALIGLAGGAAAIETVVGTVIFVASYVGALRSCT